MLYNGTLLFIHSVCNSLHLLILKSQSNLPLPLVSHKSVVYFDLILFVVVQLLSSVQLFVTPWTITRQALCPPLSPRVCSNSRPLSQRCYLPISSSAAPFCFCLHTFPVAGSFSMSRVFTSGGQSIGAYGYSFSIII